MERGAPSVADLCENCPVRAIVRPFPPLPNRRQAVFFWGDGRPGKAMAFPSFAILLDKARWGRDGAPLPPENPCPFLFQPVLAQFVVQGGAGDAQAAGGLALVVLGLAQGVLDGAAFQGFQGQAGQGSFGGLRYRGVLFGGAGDAGGPPG